MLLSETLTGDSRLMLHRDVGDRLRTLAPFLHWEDRPEVAVIGGRIQFMAHGYTTSNSFPYAEQIQVGEEQVNYMRGAVVATVDAYSGQVTMYATDAEDPILRAWREAFPSLFTAASRMPAGVRAHLRYPRELFDAQSEVWETYHMDNPDDFYTKADAWQRPAQLSGPVQKVGAIRFGGNREGPRLRPYFLLARLPGERRERFMLTTVFTPHSQENLSGYLTGTIDARGRPRLTQLSLPRSRLVLGPSQVSRQILATEAVGDQAAAAQPGDDRPRPDGREHGRAERAARAADRRLVPVRPAHLRDGAGKRRDAGPPRDGVPQRAGGLREDPRRGAPAGAGAAGPGARSALALLAPAIQIGVREGGGILERLEVSEDRRVLESGA